MIILRIKKTACTIKNVENEAVNIAKDKGKGI